MLQVLRKGFQQIVVEEVPEPTVARGEVKIKTAYSLISSGTEIAGLHPDGIVKEVIHQHNKVANIITRAISAQGVSKTVSAILDKFSELSITGYAGSGLIIDKSEEITDLYVGQRVAYGGIQTGHAQVVCAPRNLVAPVPDSVALKSACLTTVGSIALHAVRNTRLSLGDSVAVIGLGLIGQLVVQLSKITGSRVVGIDIRKDRLEQGIKQGAEIVLDASDDPKTVLDGLTGGRGVDAVIVCASSKDSRPLELAVSLCRSRARIIVVGMVPVQMHWEAAYLKELKLIVSRAYGPGSYDQQYERKGIDYPIDYVRWTENRNMEEFLRLLQAGAISSDGIITHEYPVNEAPAVFERLSKGEGQIVGAVLEYDHSNPGDEAVEKPSRLCLRSKSAAKSGQLRVGVIGLGNITRWVHLPNIKKHPHLRLQAVCTPKGYKAVDLGKKFEAIHCSTDYKDLITDPNVDLIMIFTRHDLHAEIGLAAMNAGKHVFIEKPMAITEQDCLALVAKVRENKLGFMVNFNRRYAPMYNELKEKVSKRGPKFISIRMNSPDMVSSYWMMDSSEGGGALLGEGCHFFDMMNWLTNSKPISVFARNLSTLPDKTVARNNVACVIAFEDGSVGNLIYETLGHRGLGSERVEVSSGGVSAVAEEVKSLSFWNKPSLRPKKEHTLRPDKGHYQLLDSFIEGIQSGKDFESEAVMGARATLCALAALRSLETGVPEKLIDL